MARSTAGPVPFRISAHRTGRVSRDAEHAAAIANSRPGGSQLPRLHLRRLGLGKRTHSAYGVGLSLPPHRGRGTSSIPGSDRATELEPVQERYAEMLRGRI